MSALEAAGELKRIRVEVDPVLEISEITDRVSKAGGPALLFEKVKGSRYPVLTNAMGSRKRMGMAMGTAKRMLSFLPRKAMTATCQEVIEMEPSLDTLPVLKTWPKDRGRFITMPLVVTRDPETGERNVGVYRMQVYDERTCGMHWQVHKGGAAHYMKAEELGRPLDVAVVIGCDPAVVFSAVCPLPKGLDELAFAGFARGKGVGLTKCRTVDLEVPASAEFVLEGEVRPVERRLEGPFGDHFGYYSPEDEFPVFHLKTITRKRNPVYHATVVGRPPMEDGHMGKAIERLFAPFIRFYLPEVSDLDMPMEAGFHDLAVVGVRTRYPGHARKVMLGLWGQGQFALNKCLVAVDHDVDAHDLAGVFRLVLSGLDPGRDLVLVRDAPADSLEVGSYVQDLGGKLGIDATGRGMPEAGGGTEGGQIDASKVKGVKDSRTLLGGMMLVAAIAKKKPGDGRKALRKLLGLDPGGAMRAVVVLDDDVDLSDSSQVLWAATGRFDPARDLVFTDCTIGDDGMPVYGKRLGVDATSKLPEEGYTRVWPEVIEMDPGTKERVTARWAEYGLGGGSQNL